MQPSRQPAQPRDPATVLEVPRDGRGLAVGKTGKGKSYLIEWLISRWLNRYQTMARVLILDSKPRYRAEFQLDGLPARSHYKHWKRGNVIPGSVRLDLVNPRAELRAVWRQEDYRNRVAIAQHDMGLDHIESLRACAYWFYNDARDKYAQLLVADEYADYYGSSGTSRRGDPILQVIRAGRERNVAFLGGTQRPKSIPVASLTELANLYYFGTAFDQDVERLAEMGYRAPVDHDYLKRHRYSFWFYGDEYPDAAGYYRIAGKP